MGCMGAEAEEPALPLLATALSVAPVNGNLGVSFLVECATRVLYTGPHPIAAVCFDVEMVFQGTPKASVSILGCIPPVVLLGRTTRATDGFKGGPEPWYCGYLDKRSTALSIVRPCA